MSFTLSSATEFFEEIRKSRFLTLAAPCETPEQALAFIGQHSNKTASHNCWAYKCGAHYRFNDDGEPGGTAGRPILAAIEGQDCDNVVVLVIRWYGGIQLGTGGLARAYGGGAAKCLQSAERIAKVDKVQAHCYVPFADLARIKARLAQWQAQIDTEQFDAQGAHWQLSLPAAQVALAREQLNNLSRGHIRLHDDKSTT